jgi:hypothetical protein
MALMELQDSGRLAHLPGPRGREGGAAAPTEARSLCLFLTELGQTGMAPAYEAAYSIVRWYGPGTWPSALDYQRDSAAVAGRCVYPERAVLRLMSRTGK